ncbi:hypothetical protein JGU66_12410 [Myxococcaceae bacterium JPH2]|nr:hypothetical protein [Myxococcaceae bacterium JPH2]
MLKHSYGRVFPSGSLFWLVLGVVLIFLVVAALLALGSVYVLPRALLEALFLSRAGLFLFVLGIPAGVYAVGWRASDVFAWLRAPEALVLDAEGLRAGETRIAWREVRGIVENRMYARLVLEHPAGTYRLRLDLWDDADALHEEVNARVVPVLLERVRRQVAQGQSVRFGPLVLSDAGLTHKRQLLRWEDIDSIRRQDEEDESVSTRELIIVARGKSRKIDEAKIPNAPVLLAYLSARLAD